MRTVCAALFASKRPVSHGARTHYRYLLCTRSIAFLFRRRTSFRIVKGPSFSPVRRVLAADLTKEMLDSGSWSTTAFKEYNIESAGQEPGGGHVHALMKVRAEFRQILLEMGFSEMPTNRFVESSFWNFDALFQPQSHPSRDMHDTFFIAHPASTLRIPADYLARVKEMHEVGGFGSIGYHYEWMEAEARKNLLRTHTTAVSARMLYKLANVSVMWGVCVVRAHARARLQCIH